MAFDFGNIQLQADPSLLETGDTALVQSAKSMFYEANDSFLRGKRVDFHSDFCKDFTDDILDFQIIDAPAGRGLSINLVEKYIAYFANMKSATVAYILVRMLTEKLEFFKSVFPGGIWTKNVITGRSRHQYPYMHLLVGSCSALSLEINQATMKALQWLSANFNAPGESIRLILSVLFPYDKPMEGFKYIYNFLKELHRFDRDRYITLDKDPFVSLLYAYQRCNNCDIQTIIARVNYYNDSVIPASEALNYLIQVKQIKK